MSESALVQQSLAIATGKEFQPAWACSKIPLFLNPRRRLGKGRAFRHLNRINLGLWKQLPWLWKVEEWCDDIEQKPCSVL
mmetsp:Transcript_10481/g.64160  ORF Transcript_10481/g.64160 Transcript_10481/m.64160 type:complete len:80 (-) Transcript_10481:488-727(-)